MSRIVIPGAQGRPRPHRAALATAARLLLSLSRQFLLHLTLRHPGKLLVALLLAALCALGGAERLGGAVREAGQALALALIRAVPGEELPRTARRAEEKPSVEPERAATPAPSPVTADSASGQPETDSEAVEERRRAILRRAREVLGLNPAAPPPGRPAEPVNSPDEAIREAAARQRSAGRAIPPDKP